MRLTIDVRDILRQDIDFKDTKPRHQNATIHTRHYTVLRVRVEATFIQSVLRALIANHFGD